MAKNNINQKSNKNDQLGSITSVQFKAGSIKGACGPTDPACSLKVNSVSPPMALTHERIAERARVIWQSNGCRPGEDKRNWSEAEAQLKAESSND
jgi:hypothetical protein